MKYDLHTHTKYSDGELTIDGNVKKAIELGLDGIAITDHDNIDTWQEIDNNEYEIPIIKGVELSTYYKGESVHILGYYLNNNGSYEKLDQFLKDMRHKREKRTLKIIELLKEYGINITYKNIEKFADGAIGRPHIAKAIIEAYPQNNYTIQDIFDLYIGDGKPCFVKISEFQTEDAIRILKENNCLAILAHPLIIKKVDYREILSLGVDGVECYYPYDENKDYQEVINEAKKRKILITGGSDYHGPTVRNTMGREYLEGEELIRFLKSINKTDYK